MRKLPYQACSWVLSSLCRAGAAHPAAWRRLAAGYRPWLDRVARWHAAVTCRLAAIEVPAYRDYLTRASRAGAARRDLAGFPETAKASYAGVYTQQSRCRHGQIPSGTVVDESSGSSGKPYNWLRGRAELTGICRNVAGYTRLMFPDGPLFVINAYSMGAWATGTTTGAAMARVAIVKNTGPDVAKIADTLRHFGPRYRYLVTAYPPFLKHLRDALDADGFCWDDYRIDAMAGGEALTEALRDYLQERFGKVRSGYGASDLTIGIGAESGFTVWLRRRLRTDADLRRDLLGAAEQRLPMIFHYNPLETYLEVSEHGELLCTVSGRHCLQPKLRYNVGDEALLYPLPRVLEIAGRERCRTAMDGERISLPLLFLFGRKDSTVSYMGANLYPQDVEYGLYQGNPHAAQIAGFCLTLEERADLECRPVVSIELRGGLRAADRTELAHACQRGVVGHLARVSRDFAEALREDPAAGDLQVRVFDPGTGPFAERGALKNSYLVSRLCGPPTSRRRRRRRGPAPCSSARPGTAAPGRCWRSASATCGWCGT